MQKKKRRKYDQEFKTEALRLVIERHQSCQAVEKALGLPFGLIKDWVRAYKSNATTAFVDNGHRRAHQGEIETLKRENELLRKQRDILKKPYAFSQWIRCDMWIHK
ncbi:MAG: transposase [Syntrophaceae bacterium]|nr:transposase [Syntrophaceae bacterium]